MKIYFGIFLLLSTWPTFGQLLIDSTAKDNFKTVANSPNYRIMAKVGSDVYQSKGVAIITNFKEDTLNHDNYIVISKSSLGMVEADLSYLDSTGKEVKVNLQSDRNKNLLVFAKTKIIQDTLSLLFSFPDPNGDYRKAYEIFLNLKEAKPNVIFVITNSEGYSLKKQMNIQSQNRLRLSSRLDKFVLDRIPKTKNEEFYGEAAFVTNDYFEINENFKSGYLHKQHRVKLFFRCKL